VQDAKLCGVSLTSRRFVTCSIWQRDRALAIYSRCVNAELPIEDVLATSFPWCAIWAAQLKQLFAVYVEAKQRQNVLDYDDLLLYWAQMVNDPGLAERRVAPIPDARELLETRVSRMICQFAARVRIGENKMRMTCPLLVVGIIVGSGVAVFADTPQSGRYCASGKGYGEIMFLAQQKPDGGLDFGLLLSTTEGNIFCVAGTARRVGSGWRYETDMNSADPYQRCARTGNGTYLFSTVEGARCESYAGYGAAPYKTLAFPPSSRVGSPPATFALESHTDSSCDRPRKRSHK
jgi:hypothetical protein